MSRNNRYVLLLRGGVQGKCTVGIWFIYVDISIKTRQKIHIVKDLIIDYGPNLGTELCHVPRVMKTVKTCVSDPGYGGESSKSEYILPGLDLN